MLKSRKLETYRDLQSLLTIKYIRVADFSPKKFLSIFILFKDAFGN